ncbi:hypothetical protein A3835_09530 [Campylobacter concisus]|uniref:Uncharacterized protein n=1 Tax=Campylobacter concisus TaxID=199 RepID=A0A1X0U4G8_9BACT|nr:hypothetical protein A3835_09530 [Campylobacter concisus]
MGGAAFKSGAKDKKLNEGVPPKEQGARTGKTIWRLKLGAYLYTLVFYVRECFTLAPLTRVENYTLLR